MSDLINRIQYDYRDLDEAFPPCDPLVTPSGSRVLVQMKTPKKKTKGGILLTADVKETEFWATQVGKVLAIGPVAFRDRRTLEPWKEGDWCQVGDYVRVPRQGGDRWTVRIDDDTEALFIVFDDLNIIGKVTGDPLAIKAYI